MNRTQPLCVAVIDDDESICRSLSRLLRVAGMHPVAYSSAEAFLGDTTQPLFDCLVLDVHLGGMSGIELGRRLRAGGSQTPLIYLTAHDDPDTRLEAEALGCAGFFSKADAGSLLLHTIRRLAGVSP